MRACVGLDRLVVCTTVGVLLVCPSFAHANHFWFRIWRSQGTSGGHQAFDQSVFVFWSPTSIYRYIEEPTVDILACISCSLLLIPLSFVSYSAYSSIFPSRSYQVYDPTCNLFSQFTKTQTSRAKVPDKKQLRSMVRTMIARSSRLW